MYRSQNRLGGLAPTIGVLLDWVGDSYQVEVLRGLERGATSAGANLLCFVGGTLPSEEQGNARQHVYGLASSYCVDGLVLLASTLVHQIGADGLARYSERYRPLPVCSIGIDLPGFASLTVDNETGIREAVTHLIKDHGLSRLAFVRGPVANAEAEQRYDAYRAALAHHGLALDERRVALGDFSSASGFHAVEEFSKAFGARLDSIDAIIAANDGMALGALRALGERGLDVPGRVAVIGFDDTEDGRLNQPPLTTVRQPLEKMGQEAIRGLLSAIQHRSRPDSSNLSTELLRRRSCGCPALRSELNRRSAVPEANYSFEAFLVVRRQYILDRLTRAAHGALGAAGPDWAGRLLSALVSDLSDPNASNLETELTGVMDKLLARGVDLNVCDDVVSALRRQVLPPLKSDPARRDRAEELFQLARLSTSSNIQRSLARDRLQTAHAVRSIAVACNAFTSAFSYDELRAKILEQLPRLGIASCFIALYPEDGELKSARLFLGYEQGVEKPWPQEALFETRTLLPKEWVHGGQNGRSFVVMPLVWKAQLLGHALLEFHLSQAFAYGPVAEAIGSALHGAALAAR